MRSGREIAGNEELSGKRPLQKGVELLLMRKESRAAFEFKFRL
jgi:hypothetical protein